MIDTDKRDFGVMLSAVASLYARELTPGVMSLYWHALEGYDLAAVRDAFNRHVHNPDTGQFMPKPADLIRMMQGSTQDSAMQAWAKVDRALRSIGCYADVVFDDALIHRVLTDMGGWIALGTKTVDEWPFVAREFEVRYRAFKSRSESPEYPAVLIGIAGMHNRNGEHDLEPPVLIGDPGRASVVMLGGADKPLVRFTRAADLLPVSPVPALAR